uniref:Polymerase PB2 n=1 Tax=Jiujie Fly Virus TaxID=1608055 RepID=A0A1L3KKP8_9ORTO|nr:polymerase PB2 [Jiujie Fly Virus]
MLHATTFINEDKERKEIVEENERPSSGNPLIEEGMEQLRKIKEMSEENTLTNLTMLRRYANPIKDPDPLSATMTALSYKYPLIMKREFIQSFRDTSGLKLIDLSGDNIRTPGWLGCKKEAIEHYISTSEIPSPENIEIINDLYKTHVEKYKIYQKLNWMKGKLEPTVLNKEKTKVPTQVPLIKIRREDINPLIAKILSPNRLVSDRVQKIYNEHALMLSENIPKNVAMSDQVHALRALLDEKIRYIPIIKIKYSPYLYQYTTSLFSNRWQMHIDLNTLRSSGMPKDVQTIDLRGVCNHIIKCIMDSRPPLEMNNVAKILYIGISPLYEMLELYMGEDVNVLYIKSLCHFKTKNVIHIKLRNVIMELRPQYTETTNVGTKQVIHFKTPINEGICIIHPDRINLVMGWAMFEEVETIVALFLFLMDNRDMQKLRTLLKYKSLGDLVEKHRREKNTGQWIQTSKMRLRGAEIAAAWVKLKKTLGTVSNIKINIEQSPHSIEISDNCGVFDPIETSDYQQGRTQSLPVYINVNEKEIINISGFITVNKKTPLGYAETREVPKGFLLVDPPYYKLLPILHFENRVYSLFLYLSSHHDSIYQNILRREYLNFVDFFSDYLDGVNRAILQYTCRVFLEIMVSAGKLYEYDKRVIAFIYMWAGNVTAGTLLHQFTLKQYTIDLNFESSTQNERNLFWTDKDNKCRCFSHFIEEESPLNVDFVKTLMLQGQVSGYRIEVYNEEELEEDYVVESKEEVFRELSRAPDGDYRIVFLNVRYYKFIRDKKFVFNISGSSNRLLKNLKKRPIFDNNRLQTYYSKRTKYE